MPTKSQIETQAFSGKDHTFLHLRVRSAGDNWAAVSMSAMAVGSHDSYSCSCDLSACEEITPFIQKTERCALRWFRVRSFLQPLPCKLHDLRVFAYDIGVAFFIMRNCAV